MLKRLKSFISRFKRTRISKIDLAKRIETVEAQIQEMNELLKNEHPIIPEIRTPGSTGIPTSPTLERRNRLLRELEKLKKLNDH